MYRNANCRLALDQPTPTSASPFAGLLAPPPNPKHPPQLPPLKHFVPYFTDKLNLHPPHPSLATDHPPVDPLLPPLQLDLPLPPEFDFHQQDDGPNDLDDFGIALQHDEGGMRPMVAPDRELAYSNSTRVETNLLKLLTDMGAPLYGFQSVMEWAQDAQSSQYGFDPQNKTYEAQVNDLKNGSRCRT